MAEGIRKKVLSGFVWKLMETVSAHGVSFIVSIILARLLEPSLYGTIALVTVFTTILEVFIDSGLGNALVQKKNADDVDFSSVFYFNMFICTVLYLGMYFAAPFIADFYGDSELTLVIRVMCLVLIISGLKNVQQAYVAKQMIFKKFFFATFGGTLFSAVVGISMAYMGFGVWALVFQNLSNALIDTIVLWCTVKWRPVRKFSFKRLKRLISFGWKILAASLIENVYTNIRQLIIGKMYSSADLAYYNRGKQIPSTVINCINSSIAYVIFSAMSIKQDSKEQLKNMTRASIRISSFLVWPLMMGVFYAATPIIELLLTDKWLVSVPYLRIFCITYALIPVNTANLNAIKAMGRSDINLALEVIKKVIGIIVLVSTMWFGVMAMAYSLLFTNILSQMINSAPNKKLLGYGYIEQLKDILPSFLLAAAMGIVIVPLNYLNINLFAKILLQVICGGVFYLLGAVVFKMDSLKYIIDTLKKGKKTND